MLHVLAISLDASLADAANPHGDAKARQVRYAELAGRLSSVVYAPDLPSGRIALSDRCEVHHPGSRRRWRFIRDAVRIGEAIHRERPIDIIATQDPFGTGLVGLWLKKRLGVPLNVQIHSDFFDNPEWLAERTRNRLLQHLGKWLVTHADSVRVGTTLVGERVIALGVDRGRVAVIPVAVDIGRFSGGTDAPLRERWLQPGERHVILWAGRLAPEKDLSTLICSFVQLRKWTSDARLVICGTGPEETRLRREAESAGVAPGVTWLGAVEHARMPEHYRSADVVALTSRYEGTSLVLAEAAASGRPVVSTAVSGAADLVRDGVTGYVVPIGDAAAVADRLNRLLADPAGAREMGERGRAHVTAWFDPARTTEAMVGFWRQTVEKNRG